MKHYKKIREQPWKKIISDEWKRAKEILPGLRHRRKPKFYWALTSQAMRSRTHGTCSRGSNTITFKGAYMKSKVYDDNFLNILRHELTHLVIGKHGDDFLRLTTKLGGKRWATANFVTQKRIPRPKFYFEFRTPTGEFSHRIYCTLRAAQKRAPEGYTFKVIDDNTK